MARDMEALARRQAGRALRRIEREIREKSLQDLRDSVLPVDGKMPALGVKIPAVAPKETPRVVLYSQKTPPKDAPPLGERSPRTGGCGGCKRAKAKLAAQRNQALEASIAKMDPAHADAVRKIVAEINERERNRAKSRRENKIWQRHLAAVKTQFQNEAIRLHQDEVALVVAKAEKTLKKAARAHRDIARGICAGCAKGSLKRCRATMGYIDALLAERGTRLPRRLRKLRNKVLPLEQ